MRLDANYNLCSKLGSKLIFGRNDGNFSFAGPFPNFDRISPTGIFFRVRPDKIYARQRSWSQAWSIMKSELQNIDPRKI
jgi:hypothetical protein